MRSEPSSTEEWNQIGNTSSSEDWIRREVWHYQINDPGSCCMCNKPERINIVLGMGMSVYPSICPLVIQKRQAEIMQWSTFANDTRPWLHSFSPRVTGRPSLNGRNRLHPKRTFFASISWFPDREKTPEKTLVLASRQKCAPFSGPSRPSSTAPTKGSRRCC